MEPDGDALSEAENDADGSFGFTDVGNAISSCPASGSPAASSSAIVYLGGSLAPNLKVKLSGSANFLWDQ
jgi:hypothetical protein